MPMQEQHRGFELEINLTKLKWTPKHIQEIADVATRAFERKITIKDISPIKGTDRVKEWTLKKDEDIAPFAGAPTMMQEWIAEKAIKLKIPLGIMPMGDFTPKKTKILCTGERLAKFFGEDTVSTRQVEVSLKLFDCGHFYMKQTLPGSGASPYWTVFEGKWDQTRCGVRLDYLFRYHWQTSRKPFMEFALEATRFDMQNNLAFEGETEKQLNGNMPACVGTDDWYWGSLSREGSAKESSKIRWNEDLADLSEEAKKEQQEAIERTRIEKEKRKAEKKAADEEDASSGLRERKKDAATDKDKDMPEPKSEPKAAAPEAAPASAPASASSPSSVEKESEEKEEMWPFYIGLAMFLFLTIAFLMAYSD